MATEALFERVEVEATGSTNRPPAH